MTKPRKPRRKNQKMSRRQFVDGALKTTAAAGFLVSLGAGCVSKGMRNSDSLAQSETRKPNSEPEKYDYVIVGSGAGGGVLACRLAEKGFRVCLLEAGLDHTSSNTEIPAYHARSTEDPNMNWAFYIKHYDQATAPGLFSADTKFSAERNGIFYPRGATLGGSTVHNAMIAMYPNESDWRKIQNLFDDSSWAPEKMWEIFRRIEKNNYFKTGLINKFRTLGLGDGGHGYKGWLYTEMADPKFLLKDQTIANIVMAANDVSNQEYARGNEPISRRSMRGPTLLDPNTLEFVRNKKSTVISIPKLTRNGRRYSIADRIRETKKLHPDKLTVKTGHLATEVIFAHDRPTEAIGVRAQVGEHIYEADPLAKTPKRKEIGKAEIFGREIILAGGAFNTPQLLMLSGIGAREEVEGRWGIPCRVHRPGVGRNLQDRYEISHIMKLKRSLQSIQNCTFGEPGDPCEAEYRKNEPGHIYASNGVVVGYLKKSSVASEPDLCIFAVPGHFRGYYDGWSAQAANKNILTWAVLKGQTSNRTGTVRLQSRNPLAPPDIHFRFFPDGDKDKDLQAVVEGLQTAMKMNKSMWLKDLVQEDFMPAIQGAVVKNAYPKLDPKDEQGLRDYIRQEAWGHHASCTNKMGPANDEMSVVDNRFRVHGTKNLRVVDASVFPDIPGLFIAVPIFMIAEKAADILEEDARQGSST